MVEDRVVVEVKAVDEIHDIHVAQVLTYMTHGDDRVGLLLNFNDRLLKDGIRRLVRGLPDLARPPDSPVR